jgi:hypothetical protein
MKILLIQSGTAGDATSDAPLRDLQLVGQGRANGVFNPEVLHNGGLVFLPANTWISGKNIGAEPIALTFVFSARGFEDTMRRNSVSAGETPTQITPEHQRACAHMGHFESAGGLDNLKK